MIETLDNDSYFVKYLKRTYEVLDEIDLKPYIESRKELQDIMDELEGDYEESDIVDDDYFDGCLFNQMTVDEFADYLRLRYPNLPVIEAEIITFHIGTVKESDFN